jgi:hypothetical protein
MTTMQKPGKILVASQYYVPDPTTTAVYMTAIAEGIGGRPPSGRSIRVALFQV